ncbi:hypothetical protein HGK34_04300 [Myceligenerans sp. I2]|uniref:Uncharacterized protein n=2 Tax=Myceligenerans indicum TaxID=2593663 RepID=A0ABS1LGZ9_9MICO|nr:hypothetical protein [Myceligenerans indicum]
MVAVWIVLIAVAVWGLARLMSTSVTRRRRTGREKGTTALAAVIVTALLALVGAVAWATYRALSTDGGVTSGLDG